VDHSKLDSREYFRCCWHLPLNIEISSITFGLVRSNRSNDIEGGTARLKSKNSAHSAYEDGMQAESQQTACQLVASNRWLVESPNGACGSMWILAAHSNSTKLSDQRVVCQLHVYWFYSPTVINALNGVPIERYLSSCRGRTGGNDKKNIKKREDGTRSSDIVSMKSYQETPSVLSNGTWFDPLRQPLLPKQGYSSRWKFCIGNSY
jgi:hypothetical protein